MPGRCHFPDKQRYTKAEAKMTARALNRRPGVRPVYPYHCPAGHHHVGHRYNPKRKAW